LESAHTNQSGTYRLVASNSFGVVYSDEAVLTVRPNPPTIVWQPTNLTVFAGQRAEFDVARADGPESDIQWRRNDTNLPGATLPWLILSNTTAADAGDYTVVL